MTTVLATGGAGNLGRKVAIRLAEGGYSVRVFDLPGLDYSFAEGQANIEVVVGDVRDRPGLAQACRGVEWAVHLAAIMPPLSEENRDLAYSVNVEGTQRLIEALGHYRPIVFASSVSTYGVPRADIVDVEHPQEPIDFYGETKLQNERDIQASGRPYVLLRISGISVPALLEIPRPWFFTREQRVEFVHLWDAATAVAGCVDNVVVLGQTLQIAGGETWRKIGEEYSRAICQAFEIPPHRATYLEQPGWPGWYDTSHSQSLLQYQSHTFEEYISQLRSLYRTAVRVN